MNSLKQTILKSNFNKMYSKPLHTYCSSRKAIITILEATSKVGRHLALLLKQNPLVGELRLYEKSNDAVFSLAEDLSHIDTKTVVKSFGSKSVLNCAIKDADIVLSVGGCREAANETAQQTFERNIEDLRSAILHLIEFNPKAIFCIAKPPIEVFVPLAVQEFKKAEVLDERKIIGLANVGSMRANAHIAAFNKEHPLDVLCPIVGGVGADSLISVFSQSQPGRKFMPRDLQKAIANSENDTLKLYGGCHTASLAPALAIHRFVTSMLKAQRGDTNCVECAFIKQTGHIEPFLSYMTSIVILGRHGIMSSHMPYVSSEEAHLLKKAAVNIRKYINMGEGFVTGSYVPEVKQIEEEGKRPKVHKKDPKRPALQCGKK